MLNPEFVKRLSRPIADNVVANLIAAGVLYVGAGATAWIAARSAYLKGWPLYKVIFLGAAVFLIIACAANLIDLVIVRHQRLSYASMQGPAIPERSHPLESVGAAPNLVALDPKTVMVGEDHTLFECEVEQALVVGSTAVAVIRNQGIGGLVGLAKNVRAHIQYSQIGGSRKHGVDNGVWLNTQDVYRDFPVGHTEKLVLAFERSHQNEVFTYESNYITKDGETTYAPLRQKLSGNIYLVTVHLVGGEHGEIKNELFYRLVTQPDLSVEKLDGKDMPAAMPEMNSTEPDSLYRDRWVRQIADTDMVSIDKVVKVCEIDCKPNLENSVAPYLDFSFHVFNNSLYEITIDDLVEGYITFHGKRFHDAIELKENQAKDCSIRDVAYFVLHQSLTTEEARSIQTAADDGLFWFTHLRVTIKGGSRFQHVTPKFLDFNKSVRKSALNWTASPYDIS